MSHESPNTQTTIHISPQSVLIVVGVLLVLAVAFLLRNLLMVVFAAVVFAAAVEPAIQWFHRRKISRLLAAIAIYLLIATIFIAVLAFLVRPFISQVLEFLNSLPQYWQSLQAWTSAQFGTVTSPGGGVTDAVSVQEISRELRNTLSELSGGVLTTISNIFGGILSFILIVVLSFYLSVTERGVAEFLRMITPTRYEGYVLGLWTRSERKIALWMQGQLILMVIIGVLTYIGLVLLGVEHALLLAVLAGAFEIIPLFGPILAMIPAILIGFTTEGIVLALLITGLYIVIQQLENHVIYPIVVKKVVGLSPIVIIIALVAGGQLAGFLGIVLSVPIAAILMEVLNDVQGGRNGIAKAPGVVDAVDPDPAE
ncbi:MAG: AI-2E family transporter [Candidatus Paceibacterota bacterium]